MMTLVQNSDLKGNVQYCTKHSLCHSWCVLSTCMCLQREQCEQDSQIIVFTGLRGYFPLIS